MQTLHWWWVMYLQKLCVSARSGWEHLAHLVSPTFFGSFAEGGVPPARSRQPGSYTVQCPHTCKRAHSELSSHVAHTVAMWRFSSPPHPSPPFSYLSLFGVMLIVGCQWLRSLLLWDAARGWEGVTMVTPVAKGGGGGVCVGWGGGCMHACMHGGMGKRL